MANIVIVSKLSHSDTPDITTLGGDTQTIAQVTTGAVVSIVDQSVTTASELLDIGDLSYPLYVKLVNKNDTNAVNVAVDNANATNFAQLLADNGSCGPFLAQNPIYLKAAAGTCIVRALMVEP